MNPLKELYSLAKINPLEAAAQTQKLEDKNRKGHVAEIREIIGLSHEIARTLTTSKKKWAKFIAHEFWKHRKKRPTASDRHKKPLLHVLVFNFNGKSKQRYDRAQKYFKATKSLFAKGVPATEIPQQIAKAGGINKMLASPSKSIGRPAGLTAILPLLTTNGLASNIRNLREGQQARLTVVRLPVGATSIAEIVKFKCKPQRSRGTAAKPQHS